MKFAEGRKRMMKKLSRLLALVMCVCLILTLFVSSAYIAANASHDCMGHDCRICEHIAEAMSLMNSFVLIGLIVAHLFALLACADFHMFSRVIAPASATLVDRKIRLND